MFLKEEGNEEANNHEIKNDKDNDMQSIYCIKNISLEWIKEFCRTDPTGASLFLHPKIHLFWRVVIPLSIFGTIVLFIISHSSIGASISFVFQVGRRIKNTLYTLDLIHSFEYMWYAGVYLLLISIAIFSQVWPYVKILLVLIIFVLPSSLLNKRKREVFLMILDATGKLMILDSYILIFMIFIFHYTLEFPVVEPSKAEKGSVVNVFVYVPFGFYGLIIGTIISLILSHIIIHLHRSIDEHPEQNKGKKAESYIALISFAKNKYLGKIIFRVLISILLYNTQRI